MKVGYIGAGSLGTPLALATELQGHEVTVFDVNPEVEKYFSGELPYPRREERVPELLAETSIRVAHSIGEVVATSDLVFAVVQTPHRPEFEGATPLPDDRTDFDYQYLKAAVADVAREALEKQRLTTLVVVSTCLPGTFRREIAPLLNPLIRYGYNPCFPAMGGAIDDYLHAEFNLIGVDDPDAADLLENFYGTINDAPCVRTDITTAEGIKVSYNTWITAKTVIANAWGELSERLGMNFGDIHYAWSLSGKRLLSSRYMDAGMSDGGGCFPPGEMVMTRDGMRPIEAIKPGDEVLTAEGRFQPVIKRWERQYDGDLVSVRVRGLPPVRMTVEHPVLTRGDGRRRVSNGRRNTANSIKDCLLPPVEVRADELSTDSLIGWPHIKDGSYPLYAADYIRLAGWYLSEGSADLSARRGRLRFDLHAREERDAHDIAAWLQSCAIARTNGRGANAKITHRIDGNRRSVRFGNKGLAERLVADFGKGAASKRIPESILWGDAEQAKSLLWGLFRGDGHRSERGVSYSTISEQLAWGVWTLLHRLGLNPTMRDIPPRGNHKRAFEVRVRNRRLASELCAIVGWEPYAYDREIQTYADDGLTVWRHVRSLDREAYTGPVYNLWVAEDNTYVVGCGAVHNCHPRDNIAMSWLAGKAGMSHNIWEDLMAAREDYEAWHASFAAETAIELQLPLVLLGKAFKPETDIQTGSPAMLMAEILRLGGAQFVHADDVIPNIAAVYFIATKNERYAGYEFAPGSVVIDPFGFIGDRDGVVVKRLGRL